MGMLGEEVGLGVEEMRRRRERRSVEIKRFIVMDCRFELEAGHEG